MKTDVNNAKKIHLIGIGGCSMSGIAQILSHRGCRVTGSDIAESPFTQRLEENGIKVAIGEQVRSNIPSDCELVIYSAAIKPNNPELEEARKRGLEIVERRDALGQLTQGYKSVVGISGCHGKTTITSMLGLMAQDNVFDATVHVGGLVDRLNGGVYLGSHDLFITEACEYVESFLSLRPTTVLINNIDDDHLDYYKDINEITGAFKSFISLLPINGTLIACVDNPRVKSLYNEYDGKKISYGLKDADFVPINIQYDELGNASFDILHSDGTLLKGVKLNVIGEYNMINALGAILVALSLEADFEAIKRSLASFSATRRRFEYYGSRNGVKVFHDYAHHPGEIRAVLNAAKRYPHGKMFVVFQCNSYSRAKTLFLDKMDCFNAADTVLVPDIYLGRGDKDPSIETQDMVAAIERSGVEAVYLKDFETIDAYLLEHARPGDIVIALGSGDVYKKARIFVG